MKMKITQRHDSGTNRDNRRRHVKLFHKFVVAYRKLLEKEVTFFGTLERKTRIIAILNDFGPTLDSLDPLDRLNKQHIITAVRNSAFPCADGYVADAFFEMLVKEQIKLLQEQSLSCVEQVYDEMLEAVEHCIKNSVADLSTFPLLHCWLVEAVTSFIKKRRDITNEMVNDLVAIQMVNIDSKHPDLVDAYQLSSSDIKTVSVYSKLSQQEQRNCYILQELITRYFKVTRNNIKFSVPRAIIHLLVNNVMDCMSEKLSDRFYDMVHQQDNVLTEVADMRKTPE